MLVQVPKGKKFFVGRFKFVEGEVIPPSLTIGLKEISFSDDPIDFEMPMIEPEKPKRKYTRKANFSEPPKGFGE